MDGIYTDWNRREPYQVLAEADERENGPYKGLLVRVTVIEGDGSPGEVADDALERARFADTLEHTGGFRE